MDVQTIITFETNSPDDTEAFGHALGSLLEAGTWVGLDGDLGAGKTCFVRGVASGLGVPSGWPVTSPTFTLLNVYEGRIPLYHLDLYRLSSEDDLEAIGYYDLFTEEGVVIVEWAGRISSSAPSRHLSFLIDQLSESRRRFSLTLQGWSLEDCGLLKEKLSSWLHND